MFGGEHVQTGAGRYYQHHGALKRLGEETSYYGKKIFLLYADETVKGKTSQRAEESLNQAGLEYTSMVFEGASTAKSFQKVAEELKSWGAEVVVGIGGGRVIDIAKAASDLANIRVFTVPTSAATCAACAVLYVKYGENGGLEESCFLKHEISGVLADLDYILDDCPLRYFTSGLVDAMAKHPEFTFTSICLGDDGKIPPVACATLMGDYTYKKYLEKGVQAVEDFKNKADTPVLDDFVNMNIMMTGLISSLSVGGKSLALAHNYYDAICCLHPEIRKNYLHGELVGMALPMQLYVNGAPEEEIRDLQSFLRKLEVPVTLEEIGFPKDKKVLEELSDYIYRVTVYESEELREKIHEGMEYLKGEKW